jgi:sortase A
MFEQPTTSGSRAAEVTLGEDGLCSVDDDAVPIEHAVRIVDEHEDRIVVLHSGSVPTGGKPADADASRPAPVVRRSRSARASRVLALVLIGLGVLVLLDAGVTMVWQEPFTALYARLRQDHLNGSLRAVERAAPTPVERRVLASLPEDSARIEFLAREMQRHARSGSAVARITIPRINASYVVVDGTNTSDLESGPGIYPETVFPGIPGTTAIAGHRTTYLAPFRHIDALRLGSRILLDLPYAHFTYKVIGMRVVSPTDVNAAVANVGYTRLVLSACTPLFSAEKRLLVYARLTNTVPVGAGRSPESPERAAREGLLGRQLETLHLPNLPPALPAVLKAV